MGVRRPTDIQTQSPHGRKEVVAGWLIALPACAAVTPLGLALGVMAHQTGLPWWCAPLLAALVFAGSLEFLMVGMLAAIAPLTQIALSAFLVNFRHIFYALSFPLHRVQGKGWKAYSTFALTDEAFALTSSEAAQTWSRARIVSIQMSFHLAWILSVCAGVVLGSLVPDYVVGLDFAVTALFLALAIEAYKQRRSVPVTVVALLSSLIAMIISPDNLLAIAMTATVVALIGGYGISRWRSHA
ncbi:AzlC family ABC transporter permease [Actinomycetaceae bacterium WB03_NA08]|uniref:AzlC family ABC transporter permease n=1 Tax=Scrofimicrobium canadense TaxID=2652290 RepID=A0A6N7W900_9ACTO|nr:AzlC family ABC transporter permease [Scrofimicrobium canadense]MSS84628.1 AzlC family ABC transporter permease [Scrofimicrobium canadense]